MTNKRSYTYNANLNRSIDIEKEIKVLKVKLPFTKIKGFKNSITLFKNNISVHVFNNGRLHMFVSSNNLKENKLSQTSSDLILETCKQLQVHIVTDKIQSIV
jgi:hypothetical protein